jgi:hypothetical protein
VCTVEPQTFLRHISHFIFAMITQNLNRRKTMKLLNDRSIHDDLNHVAEKSLMAYLTNIVVSLRVTFCHTPAHRSSSIVTNITRGTLANFTSNISSRAKRGIFLKHLLCHFIPVCHFRLVSPTKPLLQT